VLTDSIAVSQNGMRRSFRIEAEEYTGMMGLQTESTSDDGGGLNLGYVDADDWVTYDIDISYEGEYLVVFRHAGYAGDFDVSIDGVFLKHITLPATSDWQDWTSDTAQLGLREGQHEMKFIFHATGLNLNWMQFDWYSELQVSALPENSAPMPGQDAVYVYPVPAGQVLFVGTKWEQGITGIRLTSLDGKTVMSREFHSTVFEQFDVSGIDKGMYILTVNCGSFSYRKKVMVE
jgi:hypothetical protein